MAKRLQLRRGTTTENNAFKGALGELTYDTQKKELRVHDGSTVGGKIIDDPTRNVTSQVSNATETTAGKAQIATTAIAQAGTNDTDIITAKKLRDVLGNAIKPRSWSNVTASRIADTWYSNTTGNDIGVYVTRAGANISASITVRKTGTSTELSLTGTGVGNNFVVSSTGFWEVPDGFDYKISVFGAVMELRV